MALLKVKEVTTSTNEKFTVVKKYMGEKTLDECFYTIIDYYINQHQDK